MSVKKNQYIPIQSLDDERGQNGVLKELREKYGSSIYAIDPYVEVFHVLENVWVLLAPCTHGVADNWIYLIEGPEKAIFIDNGYGVGNLKGLGELLTGKPCVTAPTHFHGDHAGGSAQFDEVYAFKYCADNLRHMMSEEAWNKFNHKGEDQYRPYFLEKDVITKFDYDIIELEDHALINLGEDYDIEVIHVGGHAPGETCFLDKKSRILYTGDAYFYSTDDQIGLGTGLGGGKRPGQTLEHAECMDFHFYADKTHELAQRSDEWDYCMPGHGPIFGPATLVKDTDEAMEIAINHPQDYNEELIGHWGGQEYNVRVGSARVRFGEAYLKEFLERNQS